MATTCQSLRLPQLYPRDAQTQGIEGYVVLEFVVTRTGSTADAVRRLTPAPSVVHAPTPARH